MTTTTKKRRRGLSCKHKFVRLLRGNEVLKEKDDNNEKLKCSWCCMVFDSVGALETEYKRLGVPYKMVDLEHYKKEDIYQKEYDPTVPKDLTSSDYIIGTKKTVSYSNRLQYSGYRWGQFD